MKKIIVSLVLFVMLNVSIPIVHAQTTSPVLTDDQIRVVLISLIKQVISLYQQLQSLQTQTTVSTSTGETATTTSSSTLEQLNSLLPQLQPSTTTANQGTPETTTTPASTVQTGTCGQAPQFDQVDIVGNLSTGYTVEVHGTGMDGLTSIDIQEAIVSGPDATTSFTQPINNGYNTDYNLPLSSVHQGGPTGPNRTIDPCAWAYFSTRGSNIYQIVGNLPSPMGLNIFLNGGNYNKTYATYSFWPTPGGGW